MFLGLSIRPVKLIIAILTLSDAGFSASNVLVDPLLVIRSEGKTLRFKRSDLIKRKDFIRLQIHHDAAFLIEKKVFNYAAVPVHGLFDGIKISDGSSIQFECLDGFSAAIAQERLLNQSPLKSIAYLAVELPDEQWPKGEIIKDKLLGPFRIVWKNPELSNVGDEEWPFQLASFSVEDSVDQRFPQILPNPNLLADDPVRQGFSLFKKNCFACHTLNKAGLSRLGPDLNVPMNPTEYFREEYLRRLIRNPQDLRYWPTSAMRAWPETAMSNKELDDLLRYLKHMAGRKQESLKSNKLLEE